MMMTMTTTLATTVRRVPVLLALVTLGVAGPRAMAQTNPSPLLVDADWLAERLDDPGLALLQVGPEELYAEEHVPGARWVNARALARPMPDDGNHDEHLVLELPEPEALRGALEELGVGDGSRIVIVPSGGWVTPATRVLFTLDWAGLGERTSFLDGGLEGWKAAGHPVTAASPVDGRASAPLSRLSVRSELVVSADWVRAGWLDGAADRSGFALVDARPGAFYDGVRADRGKSGHIGGAGSLPWTELFDETEDGLVTLAPVERIRALLASAGVEPGDTVVAYCHIGQYATSVILAARLAGHDVRLFDGSMNQWALLDLPVEGRTGRERP